MKSKKIENAEENTLKVSQDIRIRFNETDALGIVWHGYYLHYFEDGREAFGRKYGISYLDLKAQGYVTPIIKSSCEHKLPLRYGEIATVETTFINTLAAKIIFKYKIMNAEGKTVCTGETVQVFVDDNNDLSLTFPSFFKAWKDSYKLI
ncbi:acyl-CoA thioesterase [Tamlana sp. 2201CG12-4]|uniref:acyl-CoA thioesterase n=1 Tax=Tamlana sp. 2201CG12-4 TaxID=3112582 RepID=UPI002DB75493|nr:acyl-CoA thioesterase [Tamlana sp. 2201CG12-4]MEC3906096.1 acyl-CoA thioesterase [Tamlana sp. 2201CG12-4]